MSQVRVEEALRNGGVGQKGKVKDTGRGVREGSLEYQRWKGWTIRC